MFNAVRNGFSEISSPVFPRLRLFVHSKRIHSISKHLRLLVVPQHHVCCTAYDDLVDFFDNLLTQCVTVEQSQQIHALALLTGALGSTFLASRLVTVYARFGLVMDARRVFDESPVEGSGTLLLWNSILRVTVSRGLFYDALEIYVKMRNLGVCPDGFTLPLTIRACSFLGSSSLCKSVHGHVLQTGYRCNLHVVNELIGMYGKHGKMEEARKLFDGMGVRSQISWNTIVSCYAFNNDYVGASEIFKWMELEGVQPNSVTWTSLLSSHARCGRTEETVELFRLMRIRGVEVSAEALAVVLSTCGDVVVTDKVKAFHSYVVKGGYEKYLFVKNALICMYGKLESVDDAETIFQEMRTKSLVSWNALISTYAEFGFCEKAFAIFTELRNSDGFPMIRPNIISWSAVISGFASNRRGEDALELFRQMQLAKVTPNGVTISSILSACAELSVLTLGREIHGYVIRALLDGNILVGNGLINMYMKCGSFKEGHYVFDRTNFRDIFSWNSMISGYGVHGIGENALRTFETMVKSGCKPDNVTFVALLSACSHAGLVKEGWKIFDRMIKEFRIEPHMEHYACIVDLLGRAGFLREASDIVKSMPWEPNDCVLGALLNSCRMHKDADVADKISSDILCTSSKTTGSFMLLSNIYSENGRWEDSAKVRMSAKEKGLKKIAGQSWIELKQKVYTFSAGDIAQPGLAEVYMILADLALQMDCKKHHASLENIDQHMNESELELLLVAN